MTPAYHDDWLTIYGGDVREVLPELASDSVDCIVTSPPYWGLRDYGTASWAGGDAECDHRSPTMREGRNEDRATLAGSVATNAAQLLLAARTACGKCGAVRQDSQIGLERTPEEYVANLVAVFRELRRVLKPSGTCWLNLGDSYGHGTDASRKRSMTSTKVSDAQHEAQGGRHGGMAKQLVGIPWRVAFALQADGWYLRSDIIWSKPNPRPESVTDRPTKAHEYLFLLTRSARYYYDADAVREEGAGRLDRGKAVRGRFGHQGWTHEPLDDAAGRNLRSVWTIATRPYPGAHFAVFPPELPERCIKAGSSEKGVCPECGKPWEQETIRGVLAGQDPEAAAWIKRSGVDLDELRRLGKSGVMRFEEYRLHGATRLVGGDFDAVLAQKLYDKLKGWLGRCVAEACGRETTGWRPTCIHLRQPYIRKGSYEPKPATILDPFAGSGTTGMVANRLSRRAILIDLNPEYLRQQMNRNAQTPLGLTEGDAA